MYFQQYFPQLTSDSRQKQQEPDQASFIIMDKMLANTFWASASLLFACCEIVW